MSIEISHLGQPSVVPGGIPPNSDFTFGWEYERPLNDPDVAEVWCWTPSYSYVAGDRVDVHAHTTMEAFDLRIYRDGIEPTVVLERFGVPGARGKTSEDAFKVGCDWPVALSFEVEDSWRSGFYIIVVQVRGSNGEVFEREHFFVVRAAAPGVKNSLAFVVSTATMCAYNDWGGGNSYHGPGSTPRHREPVPRTSQRRPFSRGMVRLPLDAPRAGTPSDVAPYAPPPYPQHPWALHRGYARDYGDASWALYGRLFVLWAEANGYQFDYLTLHDLHDDEDALLPYACSIVVGHDEYWSWEMRSAIERQLAAGGNHARFAGNLHQQIRIEDDGATFVAHKGLTPDPVSGPRETTSWDFGGSGWPVAATFGLTGTAVTHVRYGGGAPRSSGGFTIYRPWHWSLEGTDLYYGDVVGGAPHYVVSYEVDGCDFTMAKGLPDPTGADGAPDDLQIVGMCAAVAYEEDHFNGTVSMMNAVSQAPLSSPKLSEHNGKPYPQFGAAMMASHDRGGSVGDGTVFVAGTTDWVVGLSGKNWFVEKITRNVLDRLGRR